MPVSASAAEGEQKRQREYVLKALLTTQLLLYHEFESRGEVVRRIPVCACRPVFDTRKSLFRRNYILSMEWLHGIRTR